MAYIVTEAWMPKEGVPEEDRKHEYAGWSSMEAATAYAQELSRVRPGVVVNMIGEGAHTE